MVGFGVGDATCSFSLNELLSGELFGVGIALRRVSLTHNMTAQLSDPVFALDQCQSVLNAGPHVYWANSFGAGLNELRFFINSVSPTIPVPTQSVSATHLELLLNCTISVNDEKVPFTLTWTLLQVATDKDDEVVFETEQHEWVMLSTAQQMRGFAENLQGLIMSWGF